MSIATDPPQVIAVINESEINRSEEFENAGYPHAATLIFPPFPPIPHGVIIKSFHQWTSNGLWLPVDIREQAKIPSDEDRGSDTSDHGDEGHDEYGQLLVDLAISHGRRGGGGALRSKAARARRNARYKIKLEDCWAIGEEHSQWEEPEWASRETYPRHQPPFSRLLAAARDFQVSRREEFQFKRTQGLYHLLRRALGIVGSFTGNHWSGDGAEGIPYIPPSKVRSGNGYPFDASHMLEVEPRLDDIDGVSAVDEEPVSEACVLLTKPEMSVRGFLALARRDAEAGWDFAPALKLARITSAFLHFLIHWDVLPEDHILPGIRSAAILARSAPRQLIEAKLVEDVLANPTGWNRSMWTIWGGEYRDRNTHGISVTNLSSEKEEGDHDDGGWVVDSVEIRVVDPTPAELLIHITPLIAPIAPSAMGTIHYIPYSRRIITSILPPLPPSDMRPAFMSSLYGLVTRPAPWSAEEKWRAHRPQPDDEGLSDFEGDDIGMEAEPMTLEKELASLDEPNELTIYVEVGAMVNPENQGRELVGMGLRGRWAMVGEKEGEESRRWWTFKDKDYVLPAFWRSSPI